MVIDTHLHESKFSLDSKVSLKEIVLRAKEIGLNGVCITDHESNDIKKEAAELSKELNFLIIVGAEILTCEGDMTVFGLDKVPEEKMHARELMDLVRKHKGVAISAHPFRQNNRGMGEFIREIKDLWGIEAFNGNTNMEHNLMAFKLAEELNIPSLGGSDAHHRHEVGKYATIFPTKINNERDLIECIRARKTCPAVYENGKFKRLNFYQEVCKAV